MLDLMIRDLDESVRKINKIVEKLEKEHNCEVNVSLRQFLYSNIPPKITISVKKKLL